MAVAASLTVLLNTLTQTLTAASESAQKIPSLVPLKDGISLLDTKNELFLSYLQNLVFLILLKLRNRRDLSKEDSQAPLDDLVIKKLVELTVYLERGALNLEGKLKYQIDKVLRAAQDAENNARVNGINETARAKPSQELDTDNEEDEKNSDDESEADGVTLKASEINDLQYRPNPSALIRPSFGGSEEDPRGSNDGVYKPPRIQATAMPMTERRDKEARKPNKSATLDEFINTELSTAPYAEPSIGSGIMDGGRRSKSDKQRQEELERREYEERNYVRLPKESKKDRAKKGRQDAGYGGEEWRGIGEGIDRIERLTKRKAGEGRGILEKSRKRAAEDGLKVGGGVQMGSAKRQKVQDIGRRSRGKNRTKPVL